MNNDKNDEIEICQNFVHVGENTLFVFRAHFNGWGKSLFACSYIEPVRYDVLAYGIAYLIKSRLQFLRGFPWGSRLRSPLRPN